jgi:hypothetical protein
VKKFVSFIVLIALSLSSIAQKDSLKVKKSKSFRGVYLTAYYGMQQAPNYTFSKYLDESIYEYDTRKFTFKIPNVGIGYVLSHKAMFIRADLSYSFGYKNIDETYKGNNTKIDGPVGLFEINPMSIYYSSGSYAGQTYYKYEDHIKGKLNLHYFDVGMVLGGNILPCFRLYTGWRFGYLAKLNYNAVQNRKADTYIITGYSSQNSVKDSFIETTQLQFKNKDVGSISRQVIESKVYTTVGFCLNFKIKERLFLIEGQYDFNSIFLYLRQEFTQDYALLKLSYVFKYSTDFGERKVKD